MTIIKELRILYIAELLLAACIAILFETHLLPSGIFTPSPSQAYTLQIVCLLTTIVVIPLSMKLLHFNRIRTLIHASEQNYATWSTIRLVLLGAVLLMNLIIYYLIGFDTSFAYLALMAVVPFLFIWPSKEKMTYERQLSDEA